MNEFNNPFSMKKSASTTTGKKPAVTRVRNTTTGSTPGKGGSMPTSYEDYRGKSAGVTVEDFEDILEAIRNVANRMTDIEGNLAELKAATSGLDAKLTATRPSASTPTPISSKPLEDKLDGLSDVVDCAARKLHDEFVEALAGLKEDLTAAIAAGTVSSVEADIDRNLDVTEFYDSVEGADFYEGFMLGKKFHLLSEADALLGQTAKEAGYKAVVGRFVNGEFAGLSDERHLRAYQALKKGAPAAPTLTPAKRPAQAKKSAAKPAEKKAVPASDETSAPADA